jgi:superfamily II DNA or RNA helicase
MREKRQEEAIRAFLNTDKKSIVNACPRFGKIRVALGIMNELNINHVWIIAPRVDIFKGWDDEIAIFGGPSVIGQTTFASIKKLRHDSPQPQMIIIDEPHELSIPQQVALRSFVDKYPTLGLTGTMTQKTRNELYNNLNLDVCYKYDINQGVEEGILVDYQMFVHTVGLDNKRGIHASKKGFLTEKEKFKRIHYVYENGKGNEKFFTQLKLINLIQNSLAKMERTRKLIKEYSPERLLVFCGTTETADQLDIPVYHSKAKEKEVFLNFCAAKNGVDQLATIKMMQAGVTINPINKGIINYMSGNPEDCAQKICRFLGFEYDNPDKKAEIHIVSTTEPFELMRLRTGLAFFDDSKITYLKL